MHYIINSYRHHNRINFEEINAAALKQAWGLVRRLLPDAKREGLEALARNPRRADAHHGSFKINLPTGKWSDFAVGERGNDLISLTSYVLGISYLNAARTLARELGVLS